jgi:acetyl-CoA carboxylase carboxyltransferase component
MAYSVRDIIETIADKDSFLEVRKIYGRSVITGFMRLEG